MKRPSAEAQRLVARLERPAGFWARYRKDDRELREVLARLGGLGEASILPDLLPFVLDRRQEVAEAAARGASRTLRSVALEDIARLDEYLRQRTRSWELVQKEWAELRPSGVVKLEGFEDERSALLALATFHPSGFVREAALERLSFDRNGGELPFLLMRVNDWVEPVRRLARSLVRERLQPSNADHFIRCLPIVAALARQGRGDDPDLLASIDAFLQREECAKALEAGLGARQPTVRREAFRLALASSAAPRAVRLAAESRDQALRLRAVQRARKVLNPEDAGALLDSLQHDPFGPIRREALIARAEGPEPLAPGVLRAACLDSNRSVRFLARHYLSESGDANHRGIYRRALERIDRFDARGVISGLAETGQQEDALRIRAFARHPSSRVRVAALRALAKLAFSDHRELFFGSLENDTPRVSREAAKLLAGAQPPPDPDRLRSALGGPFPSFVKKNLLSLSARLPKWSSLPVLLEGTVAEPPEVARRAHELVSDWVGRFNRDARPPGRKPLIASREAFSRVRGGLPESLAREIEFLLKTASDS